MKTKAAEITNDRMTGPSILFAVVITTKNSTPHSSMKQIAWNLVIFRLISTIIVMQI